MADTQADLIMPIKERYAVQILTGIKRCEIRTQDRHFLIGTRIWLYATQGSRDKPTGAILGSFLFGGCERIENVRALRHIAVEAASTYKDLSEYLDGRTGWAIKVAKYQRLREPVLITFPGLESIQRLNDPPLLRRLMSRPAFTERYPQSRAALIARTR